MLGSLPSICPWRVVAMFDSCCDPRFSSQLKMLTLSFKGSWSWGFSIPSNATSWSLKIICITNTLASPCQYSWWKVKGQVLCGGGEQMGHSKSYKGLYAVQSICRGPFCLQSCWPWLIGSWPKSLLRSSLSSGLRQHKVSWCPVFRLSSCPTQYCMGPHISWKAVNPHSLYLRGNAFQDSPHPHPFSDCPPSPLP